MWVSDGRPGEILRIDLVDVAGKKQEAKKRFRRFAFPREVYSESGPRERSTGIRILSGETL